ncbi:MAG: addiction module antidote protein, HigA family, partial [Burkholderiaceae bacterium]|nr:addiction module antidote protein, HigA family [Burkholderiaceae bacterium]
MAHMFNPPHPGLTLRDDVLPALRLTVTEAAQQFGVA